MSLKLARTCRSGMSAHLSLSGTGLPGVGARAMDRRIRARRGIRADVLAVYLLGDDGCCTLYEKGRLGALLCLDSSSFLTGYRFPMPRAKEPRGAWPLHWRRHFKPIKVSGLAGVAR